MVQLVFNTDAFIMILLSTMVSYLWFFGVKMAKKISQKYYVFITKLSRGFFVMFIWCQIAIIDACKYAKNDSPAREKPRERRRPGNMLFTLKLNRRERDWRKVYALFCLLIVNS